MVTANSLQMQVNLFVSGRKLKKMDTFSQSDPRCLLFEKKNGNWVKIGMTEQIKDNANPDFATAFSVSYFFEKVQDFKFVFLDGDGKEDDLSDDDKIGEIQVTMGQLMGARK